MQTEQSAGSLMFFLISCVLHNAEPKKCMAEETDLKQLFDMARNNSLSAIVYMALKKTDVATHLDDGLLKEWKELKEKAIVVKSEMKELFSYKGEIHIDL